MSSTAEVAEALEQAAQKHEKEIVVEFGPDRLLHYLGVYLMAFLAVVAKVSEGDSYDSQSYYLDGFRGFEPNYRKAGESSKPTSKLECVRGMRRRLVRQYDKPGTARSVEESRTNAFIEIEQSQSDKEEPLLEQERCWEQSLFGEMRDRHLFSMLCFENFSSLEYHPYILSVYKLSGIPDEPNGEGFTGSKTKRILKLLCNKKNFGGRLLVKTDLQRYMIATSVAFAALAASVGVLYKIGIDGWTAESFQCQIIYVGTNDRYMFHTPGPCCG